MKDVFIEITETDTDKELFECPPIKMFKIVKLQIDNQSGADSTVEIADTFVTNDDSATSVRDVKFKETLSSGEKLNIDDEKIVRGKLVAKISAQPVRIALGLEEV